MGFWNGIFNEGYFAMELKMQWFRFEEGATSSWSPQLAASGFGSYTTKDHYILSFTDDQA